MILSWTAERDGAGKPTQWANGVNRLYIIRRHGRKMCLQYAGKYALYTNANEAKRGAQSKENCLVKRAEWEQKQGELL